MQLALQDQRVSSRRRVVFWLIVALLLLDVLIAVGVIATVVS